jgi:RNAse (barnase) inhibitor barstar
MADTLGAILSDSGRAGVYHLNRDARDVEAAARGAALACFRIDIGRAHDQSDFFDHVSRALGFPRGPERNLDALAEGLKDLAWLPGKGWIVVLEKSKHFAAGHRHEFEQAMDVMAEVADYWRAQDKPFWTLVGGPDGWSSGFAPMPAASAA